MTSTFDIPDLPATEALGRRLGALLFPGAVVGLVGQLGAGKTHFARAVAEGLGVKNPAAVNSPTFTLIHEYPARIPIYHFDTYRLAGPREFADLGVEEYFHGDGACLVAFASDPLPAVREQVLHLLSSGRYTAPWRTFRPHLDLDAVSALDRDLKRALFQALRVAVGDESVAWFHSLLLQRGWKARPNREETGLFAVKALALLGTPRALEALAAGEKEAPGAIRKACAAALAAKGKAT